MKNHFTVKSSACNYLICGQGLINAIELNFVRIANDAGIGNAAGYKLIEVRADYAKGILGGQGGCRLTIKHEGLKLANSMEGRKQENEAWSEVWIYAEPSDLPEPHIFGLG